MKDKDIKKIVNSPQKVRFADIDKLLVAHGYTRRQSGGGSSHYIYTKEGEPHIITVPFKRPYVKEIYVKNIVKLLKLED